MAEISPEHPILRSTRRLAESLLRTEEIARFKRAEDQVQKSEKVQNLITTIKRKQKEWVHAKHYQKSEYVRQLEKELKELQQELDSLPIVREYQQSQVEVNDLLQMIQNVIADTVSKKVSVETGGQITGGCGSGGACQCSN